MIYIHVPSINVFNNVQYVYFERHIKKIFLFAQKTFHGVVYI
jgi:hypothetical protein